MNASADLPRLKPGPVACNARLRRRRGYCPWEGMLRPDGSRNRCHRHGGKSIGGVAHHKFKMGKTSKHQYLPEVYVNRFDRLYGDSLDQLDESIQVQNTLMTRIYEQLKTGESWLAWKELRSIVTQSDSAIADLRQRMKREMDENPQIEAELESEIADIKEAAFDTMREVIFRGHRDYGVQKEILKDIRIADEARRKLTETFYRAQKDRQETYTREQMEETVTTLLQIVRSIVANDQLILIAKAIEERRELQKLLIPPPNAEKQVVNSDTR